MTAQKAIFLLAGLLFVVSGCRPASAYVGPIHRPDAVPAASDRQIEENHPMPVVLNRSVEAYIEYFSTSGKNDLQTSFNNSAAYLPAVKEIFRKENLPEELAYVAMIESGFDPRAVSRAKAVGLWQLMPDTARQYRLRGDRWIDERRDLIKSTRAAARHLRFLHDRLGSWPLVLSAYNAGLTTVRAAIRRVGSDDFWDLRRSGRLARETRHFVPKFMAVILIARDPAAYGFRVPSPRPIVFDLLAVPASTDLRMLAGAIGTSYAKISSLNPEMNGPSTPPGGSWYLLKIPEGKNTGYPGKTDRPEQRGTAFGMTSSAGSFLCSIIRYGAGLQSPVSRRLANPSAGSNETAAAKKPLLIGLNRRKIFPPVVF